MIIKISKESKDIIEAYHYQVHSRKDIIAAVLNGSLNVNNEKFAAYHKEYEEFYKGYEQAKENLIMPYVREAYPDGKSHNWNLDFSTCELTIEE